ncbi:MAG: maltokinase N-terminal cap-like domain-containing protein [Nesterenkonia sp.]
MNRIRGEEQPGFVEILHNWLPHQPWFPNPRGRIRLTRVGGLRLPTPAGDADTGLFLEVHIFDVAQPGAAQGDDPVLISVPVTLRSRPSALAGKSAFIGKLTTKDDEELWVYDGAGDRAFLAAWVEMARRRQGSRNGRSRGEALAGFAQWEPFNLQLKREVMASPLPHATRVLLTPEAVEDGDWSHLVAVDILRRPAGEQDAALETVRTLTAAHSTAIPRMLGTISGAWEDRGRSTAEFIEWQTGVLGVVREAAAEAPDAQTLASSALKTGEAFKVAAEQLGRSLGTFHADLAGSFGAYPQSPEQLRTMATNAQQALADQWAQVREEFNEDEAADLGDTIELMGMQLREVDEPLLLQTIHGDLGPGHFHQFTDQRWVITEAGGMVQHAPGLRDVVTVLMSLANLVMQEASQSPPTTTAEGGAQTQAAQPTADDAAAPAQPATDSPIFFGPWYEVVTAAFLEGYRASEADTAGVDSVFFRAAMLTEALDLFFQWEGRWVFRPSMLYPMES